MGRHAVEQKLRRQGTQRIGIRLHRLEACEIDQRRQVHRGIAAIRTGQDRMPIRIIGRGNHHRPAIYCQLHISRGKRLLDRDTEMRGVEFRVHVQQKRMPRIPGNHMARCITVAQVRHILPCQGIPARGDQMFVQLCQRGQRRMGHIAPTIGPGISKAMPVQQVHTGHPLPRQGIFYPFAEDVRDLFGRPVGLVLVDIGRGMVHIGRITIRIRAFDDRT